jgi:hypothetical protein
MRIIAFYFTHKKKKKLLPFILPTKKIIAFTYPHLSQASPHCPHRHRCTADTIYLLCKALGLAGLVALYQLVIYISNLIFIIHLFNSNF